MYRLNDSDEWSTEIPKMKDAGEYTVSYKVIGDKNHKDSAECKMKLTIAKAPVAITAKNAEKHINKADPKLEYTTKGILGTDQLSGIAISRTEGETAGTYDIRITADASANPNYKITTVAATFTINDHEWSAEWKTVREATEIENGKREKHCMYDGCNQKLYDVIPATGTAEEPSTPGEGALKKEVEVAPEAPIREATLENTKSELLQAEGIFNEAEKERITTGADARVWIEITKTDMAAISKDDQAAIASAAKEIMGTDSEVTYFNADLFKQVEGDRKTQIHEPGTMMKVSITIPEELLNHDRTIVREYKILRLHNGVVDVISGNFNEETQEFSFATDKFSTYAIAYADTQLATGVTVDSSEKTLTKEGETLQLTATVAPSNATNKEVTWTTSDPEVATVDENGVVTAVSNGVAVITATSEDGSYTATCTITVEIPEKPVDKNTKDDQKTDVKPNQSQNADSKTEVPKADTKAKKTNAQKNEDSISAKAPKTGDTNVMAVWFAVLAASAGTMIVTGRKRRNHQ